MFDDRLLLQTHIFEDSFDDDDSDEDPTFEDPINMDRKRFERFI